MGIIGCTLGELHEPRLFVPPQLARTSAAIALEEVSFFLRTLLES